MSYGCWNCKHFVHCLFCGSANVSPAIRSAQRARAMITDCLCMACGRCFEHRPSQTRPRQCSNVAELHQEPEPPEPAA